MLAGFGVLQQVGGGKETQTVEQQPRESVGWGERQGGKGRVSRGYARVRGKACMLWRGQGEVGREVMRK